MAGNSFIAAVAAAALARFDAVMGELSLSGGRSQGREYLPLNPLRGDTKPGSFTINRDTGAWADFACDAKGGDLVSLAAYLRGIKQGEAAALLAGFLGVPSPSRKGGPPSGERGRGNADAAVGAAKHASGPDGAAGEACVMPVLADAPAPPAAHPRHGKPAARWAYVTAAGVVNFYHDRYEPKGERKQFSPLTLWLLPDGRQVWRFKAPPAPRPLLGLPELAAKHAPAVLPEGEKARDAAAALLPENPILCWQGGAQAVDKADFSPLTGREVWLWPDNDEPGKRAMLKTAERLREIGAAAVKRFNMDMFAATPAEENGAAVLRPGGEWNPGDDAADLLARGWTAAHLALILKRPDALLSCDNPPPVEGKVSPGDTAANASGAASRFELTERGVTFSDPALGARWVCAPLEVTALVRDPHNTGWGLLTEFSDPDRNPHRVIVPSALFRGDGAEVAGLLLDHGLKIAPKGKPLLLEYLQTARTSKRARVTHRTGWHDAGPEGGVFVLPDHAIGPDGSAWIFESDSPAGHTFALRGSMKDWQHEVAALCAGNSRLLFAVSVAFAAPLLYLAGAEGGGFHFRSNSSDGKTTALRVAASVCGGADFMQRWRATDNGLEALAMQHCDAPLLLDELAQIDPRAAGEVAYMLANGGGKARAGRTGGARERASWRVLFLSAGEIGLAEHMGEIGRAPRAGQELRLAEIPADAGAGLGVFECLHDFKSGSEFAKALDRAARRHYGVAFAAYLRELVSRQHEVAEVVREAQRQFEQHCLTEGAHGQAQRVAGRFALVGAGGELATKWGVTGWEAGAAMRAARACR